MAGSRAVMERLDRRRLLATSPTDGLGGRPYRPRQLGETVYFSMKKDGGVATGLHSLNLATGKHQEVRLLDGSRRGRSVSAKATWTFIRDRVVITDADGLRRWSLRQGESAAREIALPAPPPPNWTGGFVTSPFIPASPELAVSFAGNLPLSYVTLTDGKLYATSGAPGQVKRRVVVDLAKLNKHAKISSVTPWQDRLIIGTTNHRTFITNGMQSGTTELKGYVGAPMVVGKRLVLSRVLDEDRTELLVTESPDLKVTRRFHTDDGWIGGAFWTDGDRALFWLNDRDDPTKRTGQLLDLTQRRAADALNDWRSYFFLTRRVDAAHLGKTLYVVSDDTNYLDPIRDGGEILENVYSVNFEHSLIDDIIASDGNSLYGVGKIRTSVVFNRVIRYSIKDKTVKTSKQTMNVGSGPFVVNGKVYLIDAQRPDRFTIAKF